MSEQPQNIEGDLPDPENTDWQPDLPEGEQDDTYYGEEGSDENA
jgi:hypothetical protein